MSDTPNGPAGPPAEAPGLDENAQAAISMIAGIIQAFVSEMPEEAVIQVAAGELGQQETLGVVLGDAVDPAKRQSHPFFGFRIRDLRRDEIIAEVKAPKDLAQAKSLNELKHGVDVIAYATSPVARALLRAHGFSVEFFQAKDTPKIALS